MELYIDDELIDFENVFVKNFFENYRKSIKTFKIYEIDFSSIQRLKGNKEMLDLCFQLEKKELLTYG